MRNFLFLIVLLPLINLFASDRPDLALDAKMVFVCEKGRSLSGALYNKFCLRNFSRGLKLYVHFSPSQKILLNTHFQKGFSLGTTRDWCVAPMSDHELPACQLIFQNVETSSKMALSPTFISGNFLMADISILEKGKVFRVWLKEVSSDKMSQIFSISTPR